MDENNKQKGMLINICNPSFYTDKTNFLRVGLCVNLAYENLKRIGKSKGEKNAKLSECRTKDALIQIILLKSKIQIKCAEIVCRYTKEEFERVRDYFIEQIEMVVAIPEFHISNYDAMFLARRYDIIDHLKKVRFRKVKVGDLLVEKWKDGVGAIEHIQNSRVSLALNGEWNEAIENKQINYIGDSNISRIENLKSSIKKNGYNPETFGKYIILCDGGRIITDGSHRASCISSLMGEDESITVADWITDEGYMTDDRRKKEIEEYNDNYARYRLNIDRRKELVKLILKSQLEKMKIVIRGGGKHTEELLPLISEIDLEIVGIWDKNNATAIDEIPILTIDEIRDLCPDYILISSYRYRYEMRREIENAKMDIKIFDLYEWGIDHEFFS